MSDATAAWRRLDLSCMLVSWGWWKGRSPGADAGARPRLMGGALVHLAVAHRGVDVALPQPVEQRAGVLLPHGGESGVRSPVAQLRGIRTQVEQLRWQVLVVDVLPPGAAQHGHAATVYRLARAFPHERAEGMVAFAHGVLAP